MLSCYDIGVAGRPYFTSDSNNRVHADFISVDPSTEKNVLYATMQLERAPPSCRYYFAEGTTRSRFNEWVCIQNPNESEIDVEIIYMLGTGEVKAQVLSLAP